MADYRTLSLIDLPPNKKIVLFDGVCHLCDSFVNFVIDHDKQDLFKFASLQSEIGEKILAHIGANIINVDSIILYEPGNAYYSKSSAALQILKNLGGVFYLFSIFMIIPQFLRDPVYDWVARNRYHWFGKKEECRMPTQEFNSRFIG